jgi:hypothetical protein
MGEGKNVPSFERQTRRIFLVVALAKGRAFIWTFLPHDLL